MFVFEFALSYVVCKSRIEVHASITDLLISLLDPSIVNTQNTTAILPLPSATYKDDQHIISFALYTTNYLVHTCTQKMGDRSIALSTSRDPFARFGVVRNTFSFTPTKRRLPRRRRQRTLHVNARDECQSVSSANFKRSTPASLRHSRAPPIDLSEQSNDSKRQPDDLPLRSAKLHHVSGADTLLLLLRPLRAKGHCAAWKMCAR